MLYVYFEKNHDRYKIINVPLTFNLNASRDILAQECPRKNGLRSDFLNIQ